jgi:NADH dehydrogenase
MQPHVVIVGAGFGGLTAARRLAGAPVRISLIDRNNYHLFQPLLYQVATAGLEPEQIAKPVRAILRHQSNLTFRMTEVTGIDLSSQQVTSAEGPIAYDYLVLAVGAETDFLGLGGLEDDSLQLKGLTDGVTIRNHVLACFERAAADPQAERRAELLTFVIVGAGPTGVEMAGALAELVHLVLVKDYPELDGKEIRILLLEAQDQVLPGFDPALARSAQRTLEGKGVEVMTGARLANYLDKRALLADGRSILAETLIWGAGVQAEQLARDLAVEHGRQGRVIVEPTLQVPGHPNAYVIGDAAYQEADGQPLPMMAPVAMQMAERAADNIRRAVEGRPPQAFAYRDPGRLATIGRNAAVADFGRLRFRGFLAWVVWLVVHLIQLIGFRNRLLVLINWAWDYFFYDRAVRLITSDPLRGE